MPDEPEFVPAKYIGSNIIDLGRTGRKEWFNVDGTRRTDLMLGNGDTVMMPAAEVLGQAIITFGDGRQEYVGAGHVVRKEDEGKSEEELKAMGYQWDMGRPDFEAIEEAPKTARATRAKPQKVPQSIEVNPSQITGEEAMQ
jgi:hypothetical protein